jgi:prepilin-type N-terminal cleavage/methylation domain-containing protein
MLRDSGQIRTGAQGAPATKLAGGFTLIELMVVIVIIGVLAALALPHYSKIKEKAKEAEIKANLHNIQLSLERFAVDNEQYPQYIIGGDNTALLISYGEDLRPEYRTIETEVERCTDPMLRGGYVDSYPRNPFVRNSEAVQRLQMEIGDPLRSTFPDGRIMGTRFGASGNVMGQVLCDSRWLSWTYQDAAGKKISQPTWSNIQYEFYDAWSPGSVRAYLPGSFFYKAMGEVTPAGPSRNSRNNQKIIVGGKQTVARNPRAADATYPVALLDYMLGAWGSRRTKGSDMLGEEPLLLFTYKDYRQAKTPQMFVTGVSGPGSLGLTPPRGHAQDKIELLAIPSWTRGVNRSHIGPLWGSPYGPAGSPEQQVSYGNGNGIRDGIILWLSPGSS